MATNGSIKTKGSSIYDLLISDDFLPYIEDAKYHTRFKRRSDEALQIEFLADRKTSVGKNLKPIQYPKLYAEMVDGLSVALKYNMDIIIEEGLHIKVITPPAFVLNKGLTFEYRNKEDQKGKDLYYIFYVIEYLVSLRSELTDGFEEFKKKRRYDYDEFKNKLDRYFRNFNSPGVSLVKNQDLLNLTNERRIFYVFNDFLDSL